MAYQIKEVTVRTDNSGEGMKKIEELWGDVTSGKLPLLCDSGHNPVQGIIPVARYSGYATDETGAYDLSILGVTGEFFGDLEGEILQGRYQKFEESDGGGDVGLCTRRAWEAVWTQQKSGAIRRAFTRDYESTVPAEYAQDGRARCCLYIALAE